MKEEIKAYNSVLDLIGNTPLIKLNKISADLPGNFYAKVEAFNPGHSTKDRIALYIIEEAEKIARKLNLEEIELTTKIHRNKAHNFYRKYAFEHTHNKFVKKL